MLSIQNQAQEYFYQAEARRFRVKIGVFLLLIVDQKILLQRRYATGIDDGLYVVPMGGLEEGESPLNSIIREAQEEINIVLSQERVALCHAMYRKQTLPDGYSFYQQDLYFKADYYEGNIINLEPHKADDLRFFSLSALPTNIVPFIAQAIKCSSQGQIYSEFFS